MCRSIKRHGMRLKINTVVTLYNHDEDMTGFIREAAPERWKIMQALAVMGQNDRNAGLFEVTGGQFDAYVERNRSVEGIKVVPESNGSDDWQLCDGRSHWDVFLTTQRAVTPTAAQS